MRSSVPSLVVYMANYLASTCAALPDSVIETDVAIIGGGGSGAYAAVSLKKDYEKKVLVIEKRALLGGHTNVWTDPATNEHHSYGVEVFGNSSIAPCRMLSLMDVPVTTPSFASRNLRFADFRDGKTVDYTRASPEEWLPALQRLEQQWVKYDHMFLPTMKKFPAPKDIPKDLFMKWTDFARKYNVEAATEIIRTNVAQDPTDSTTMDMYRAFDTTILRVFAGTGDPLQTIDHNNLAVFERAMELLGDDVMYESEVISSKRTKNGVRLVVRSSNGRTVLVKARRLLVAIQPDAAKPGSLDLDANERKLLARSMANRFFVGLISHPSLPFNTTYYNIIPEASPNNRLLYPANPSFAEFRYVGDSSSGGLYRIVLSGPPGYTFEDAKQLIRTSLQKLMDTGLLSAGDANDIDFKTFDDHGSLYRSYAVKDLKDDIIRKLNALQGVRSTWRVGGAIGTTNLCMLWAQVDVVLEDLTKGL